MNDQCPCPCPCPDKNILTDLCTVEMNMSTQMMMELLLKDDHEDDNLEMIMEITFEMCSYILKERT